MTNQSSYNRRGNTDTDIDILMWNMECGLPEYIAFMNLAHDQNTSDNVERVT